MTATDTPMPAPFTNDDFAMRMSRVVNAAAEKDLAGRFGVRVEDIVTVARTAASV
jgi:hypothetical protein